MLGVGGYAKEPLVQGAQYFFDVLECNVEKPNFAAALTFLYDAGCFPSILRLPVFNPRFAWTKKMAEGLKELIRFLLMQSNDAREFEMIGLYQSIQEKHVAPLLALTHQGKRERDEQRNLKDTSPRH